MGCDLCDVGDVERKVKRSKRSSHRVFTNEIMCQISIDLLKSVVSLVQLYVLQGLFDKWTWRFLKSQCTQTQFNGSTLRDDKGLYKHDEQGKVSPTALVECTTLGL